MSGERWELLFRDYPVHRFPPGGAIQRQGDPPEHVFLLSTGLIKLVHGWPDGRSIIVALRSAPSLLGFEAALLGATLNATAQAVVACEVIRIPAAECLRMVERGGALSRWVHLEQSREICRELIQLAGLACLTARERLEVFLRDLVRQSGNSVEALELPLRDWELAQLLAITPQYLSHLMHELVTHGRVERSGGRWVYLGTTSRGDSPKSSPS